MKQIGSFDFQVLREGVDSNILHLLPAYFLILSRIVCDITFANSILIANSESLVAYLSVCPPRPSVEWV